MAHDDLGADEHAEDVVALGQAIGALDRHIPMTGERGAHRLDVADLVDQDDARHGALRTPACGR
jgi:hypothetical protein